MSYPRPVDQVCPEAMRLVDGQYKKSRDPICMAQQCAETEMMLHDGSYQLMCMTPEDTPNVSTEKTTTPETKEESSDESVSSFDMHGGFSLAGFASLDGQIYSQLQYSEIGASFQVNKWNGTLDLIGPFLSTDTETVLEGQDPVRIRQAHFQYTGEIGYVRLGIQNTPFGAESNRAQDNPSISNAWPYLMGPVDTTQLTFGVVANDKFTWEFGVNGGNYSAYPWANPYPAFYTGALLALDMVGLVFNVGVGPESENPENMRVIGDFVGGVDPIDEVHIGLNYDEVYDVADGLGAHMRTFAVYATLNIPAWLQIPVRLDYINDESGFFSGSPLLHSLGITTGVDIRTDFGLVLGTEVNHQAGLNEDTTSNTTFGFRVGFNADSAEDESAE